MSVFEVEKIYTSAKVDEVCIKDLCDSRDERVFDYALQCGQKIKRLKKKIYRKYEQMVTAYKLKFKETKNPEYFDSLLNEVVTSYKGFFDTVMVDLKKMYSRA